MQRLKLGTVACLHGNIKIAKKLFKHFQEEDIDALALIGDIPSDDNQKDNMIQILKIFSKLDRTIFILPGSHEHHDDYYNALKIFKKNKNIIDCSMISRHTFNGYDLVFIPGSDSSAKNAGFRLLKDRTQLRKMKRMLEERKDFFKGKMNPIFLSDARKFINKSSIVLCHVPPRHSTLNAIDVAVFGLCDKPFVIKDKDKDLIRYMETKNVDKTWIFTLDKAILMKKRGYPVSVHRKNVGNEAIANILRSAKVSKYICGHIHEAGGRSVTSKDKTVKENTFSKELFYNCSPGKLGRAGVVEFRDNEAKFRNILI